jgi:serine protease AprX
MEVDPVVTYSAVSPRLGRGFWASISVAFVAAAVLFSLVSSVGAPNASQSGTATMPGGASPALTDLAAARPGREVEVIAQFQPGVEPAQARDLVRKAGGRVTGDLHVINGLAASMSASQADRLATHDGVRSVSLNAQTKPQSIDASALETSYNQSIRSDEVWSRPATGRGIGVAVIDTGIAAGLPDFRVSDTNHGSRVVATAVTNPEADTPTDTYGHGTHVAGIIAGNGGNRDAGDARRGEYVGVAPDASLISVKVDDEGETSVLDVIYGIQFAIDHKDAFNIRVINLSLESTQAESYKTDPLDAAAEAAWFSGIVVVAAAGNRGSEHDAVSYAPGNDPFVISVGAVDDQGTDTVRDDTLTDWSSRGVTQDGFRKPEVTAPGSRIVSLLSPHSDFSEMCGSCIVSDEYIRAGGTSMSAPMVAGAVANLLEQNPGLTPDEVKDALVRTQRRTANGGREIQLVQALGLSSSNTLSANEDIEPNTLIDPQTGAIDYTRSRWSRSRWSRSRWSGVYTCDCSPTADESVDPTRSRWSRSRWSRSRWSTSWTK